MKKVTIIILIILAAFLFTSCGAPKVATTMTFNEDFQGTRVMSFDFKDSGELFKNTANGFEKMVEVAKANMPSQLTMKTSGQTMVFTISFTSKEDYIAKVKALLELGKSEKSPSVTFENYGSDNPFKTGILYEESFTTLDLMRWLFDAISEKGGISGFDSYGDQYWSMMQTCTTQYGEQTNTGTFAELNTLQDCSFSELYMTTTLAEDGSVSREITVEGNVSNKNKLSDKGVELDSLMASFAGEGVTHTKEGDEYSVKYTYAFTASDLDSLSKTTNAILKGTGSSTKINFASDSSKAGFVQVDIEDVVDCGYYVNSVRDYYGRQTNVHSTIIVPGNMERDLSGKDEYSERGVFEGTSTEIAYLPESGTPYKLSRGWIPYFQEVSTLLKVDSADKVKYTLSLKPASVKLMGAEDINDIYAKALENISEKEFEVKSGDTIEISCKGSVSQVVKGMGTLLAAYGDGESGFVENTPGDAYSDHFSLKVEENKEKSGTFKNINNVEISFRLDNLTGHREDIGFTAEGNAISKVYVEEMNQQGKVIEKEIPEKSKVSSGYSAVFYVSSLNIWMVGLMGIIAAAIIGLMVFLIIKKKKNPSVSIREESVEGQYICEFDEINEDSFQCEPQKEESIESKIKDIHILETTEHVKPETETTDTRIPEDDLI